MSTVVGEPTARDTRAATPTEAGTARVLHLIETGGPGGAERVLLDLARHLGPGWPPTVGLLKRGWLASQVRAAGMDCVVVPRSPLGDLGVVVRLARIARAQRCRVIHTHEFYMSLVGAVVSFLTGIPQVVTVHGRGYYAEKRRRRLMYRWVTSRAAMVAVSEDVRRFFCRVTGTPLHRMRVIYNGIDPGRFGAPRRDPALLDSAGIPRDAWIIGAVGNLYPVKGHVYLIRATPALVRASRRIHVVVIGRGALEPELRAEAQRLGVEGHVHLPGFRDDVHRWLGVMDGFAMPSLSEGLPVALLEAMAAGVPGVVTGVGGMPEVIVNGETGWVVPPADPDALAGRILDLLESPAAAAAMGDRARRLVAERFALGSMVAAYRAVYRESLALPPS
ncbi:MAG: glycosyltransferase [Candidatus Rokuibacteriota bacterium]